MSAEEVQARRPRVLVTRRLPEEVENRLCALFDVTLADRLDTGLPAKALADAMQQYDAICPTITDRIDRAALSQPGRKVRLIANFGAGTDHIDLKSARASGVVVTNTPDALTDATAELAMLLMLMAARRAGEGEREVRAGAWAGWRPTHMLGAGLSGKTLGLVGFGRIAQAVALRAHAFGMRLTYFTRSGPVTWRAGAASAERIGSLDALVAQADVVSVHTPGGAATDKMFGAALIAAMKPRSILVNTARGSIVDEEALADALRARRLAAAGLDVYEREPRVSPSLLQLKNVVLLPHLGSATEEARTAMGFQMIDNICAYFAGEPLPHAVR